MDVKTVAKGANPFLMDDLSDYSNTSQLGGGGGMNSNPFLSGSDFNISGTSENPFLSSLGGVDVIESVSSLPFAATSTNPFATPSSDHNESSGNVEFFSAMHDPVVAESQNFVGSDVLSNIFDGMQVKPAVSSADMFFDVGPASTIQNTSNMHMDRVDLLDDTFTTTAEHPEGFCRETADFFTNAVVSDDASSRTSTPKSGPPKRPPPPRPPPSKETKDLILSVTGAMEATSSHLLDRLQATRTPSPTPIRDLHSPSPTPDVSFADFLGGEPTGISQGKLSEFPSSEDFSLMGDTEVAPSSGMPALSQPQIPPRPVRPPTQSLAQVPEAVTTDIMDIFSSETQPQAAPKKTNTDILGLFNTSASEVTKPESSAPPPTTTDLLGDVFEGDLENKPSQDVNVMAPPTTGFSNFSSEPHVATEVPETTVPKVSDSLPAALAEPIPTSGEDEFDAFTAKFENAAKDDVLASDPFDPFSGSAVTEESNLFGSPVGTGITDIWGSTGVQDESKTEGFEGEGDFDAFLTMKEPPTAALTDAAVTSIKRLASADSDEGPDFSVFIKPKTIEEDTMVPALAPPPKSPVNNSSFADSTPRFNPFDKSSEVATAVMPGTDAAITLPQGTELGEGGLQRTDSQETPPTPLFDDDVSQPLEDFPRTVYTGDGWEIHLRQPNKKKITGQRFWKKVFVRLVNQGDNPVLQLYNTKDDKDPFQELPLQPCYSVSDIGAQQFDMYGKIFTVKLQYVFYKERPGVRPGQVTKAERLTNKLSQFAAYAIQGDYQGCKEFGSDLRKLGLPVEHAPQISQLFKIGCQSYEDLKQFCMTVEESLFHMPAHRDRALNYKTEEVQITAVDELYVEQDKHGHIDKQIARVRLFFLGFLAGMPDVELGLNDMWRQGKEVVGRHDIIPVITEEWIRFENTEFHSCVQQDEYQNTHIIKFKPPDASYIELMRFRVRPPKNRELPLQVKAVLCVTGNKVQLKADILVPGFSSRKLGQIPCEDVMVRFPIPECWIYLFRVEKHFRYGSIKSTHRRTGKVKGIERLLGAVETLEQSLIEVTSGQAKYEHQHRAIVWRMSRLPKEGQGAYTTHGLVCNMALTSYDQIPDLLAEYCYVEFTMPATQVSHTTVRSVSLVNGAKDDPPEKYVRYLARHEYRVGIEHTQGQGPSAYITATMTKPAPVIQETVEEEKHEAEAADSDSDSSS